MSLLPVYFPFGVKCFTLAPRSFLMSTTYFSKPSSIVHCSTCLRIDSCKCLLGCFRNAFKCLLSLPFARMPAGIVPTARLVMCCDYSQYGPTVSVHSPVCIHLFSLLLHSGCAYVPVAVVGERQENWSDLTSANEATRRQELSVGDLAGSWGAAQFQPWL